MPALNKTIKNTPEEMKEANFGHTYMGYAICMLRLRVYHPTLDLNIGVGLTHLKKIKYTKRKKKKKRSRGNH